MGHRNVEMVHAYWTHLDPKPLLALIYMAAAAHNDDTPPVYFGGWEDLARAIGVNPYVTGGKRTQAQEKVRTAVRKLKDAGVVVQGMEAKLGQRADYALALDPGTGYVRTGEGPRQFTRSDGSTYTLRLSRWRPVDRSDPRPPERIVPLDEPGAVPLDKSGAVPPSDPAPVPLDESVESPRANQGPTGTPPTPDRTASSGIGTTDVVTIKPNHSGPVDNSAEMNDDASPSRDKPEPVQTTELRAWAEANGWPMDATA
ncbi:hypothetical protein [Micrococcus luteus]|uniref:hypothetical protein n=1 Tax=Micrococcus luteus TaxID=1270 RepID=UPI00366F1AF5